jgi:hypothetical protein
MKVILPRLTLADCAAASETTHVARTSATAANRAGFDRIEFAP